jgi:hypothetical protein
MNITNIAIVGSHRHKLKKELEALKKSGVDPKSAVIPLFPEAYEKLCEELDQPSLDIFDGFRVTISELPGQSSQPHD